MERPHILLVVGCGAALALGVAAWLSLFGDEGRCLAFGVLAIGAGAIVGGRLP